LPPAGPEPRPPPEGGGPAALLNALVAQVLDDLEENRMDLETALHMLARAAWEAGYRHRERDGE